MKLEEEETVLQDGSTDTSDVELKHILFAHVNDRFFYGVDDMSRFSTDTDQNPSYLLTNSTNKNQRLTRWELILQEYNLRL